ncbi:YTH domain-containing protein ECT3 isoform X2 [Telopea speciosissima]|uniref:YTH domain-containing protein ECT3 isoform X2 n=1 Tax=Telopea speciosissima TaxID=54955 RepID=UPI001CC7E88B|nr:YTH domain-containing protein ECT3 isoform X2 [Telopea speciosissima]
MAGEKKVEKTRVEAEPKQVPLADLDGKEVASGKDGNPSDSTSSVSSSGDATSSIKGGTDQQPVADQGVYYPTTSCYGYYYPGYNGAYPEWDDRSYFNADGSEMTYPGMQSDNGSLVYYVPGYNPYVSGPLMGVDGQCVGQQPFYTSSGYLQPPVAYGSEAMPPYSWDSTFVGDALNGSAAGVTGPKANSSTTAPAPVKSKDLKYIKTNGSVDSKSSAVPLDSKSRLSTVSSNFSKSTLPNQNFKPFNKVLPQLGSNFQSAGFGKGFDPVRKFSSFSNQGQGLFPHNGGMNYRPNGRTWAGSDKFKLRDNYSQNRQFEPSRELNCGPRAQKFSHLTSTAEKDNLGLTVPSDKYNLQDFKTTYENAKFFVIKSYNEDDIHKSIKYDVWSSTLNGNKKLDAAFHDAETKSSETGTKCSVFLFFSVNGSGQFVGVAEMIGKVDFKKDMDFWQVDKWNGFFPVEWHIIKDVPNSQLRHIILENNENKPVTYSRDTQEIELKQGLEMLTIFKSYPVKTSMLDDFNFYEEREKTLHTRKGNKSSSMQMDVYRNNDLTVKYLEAGVQKVELASTKAKKSSDPKTSLISLTKNLSLNSQLPKRSGGKDPIKESKASIITARPQV